MSEAAAALGLDGTFPLGESWEGKVLTVARVTLDVEARFSEVIQQRAAAGIERTRLQLGPVGYVESLRLHKDDIAAGEYEWTGRICARARATEAGSRELAHLMISKRQPDWTAQDTDRLFRSPQWAAFVALMRTLDAVPPNG